MKPICIKGKRISNYLIKTDKVTYPIEASKYLETLPLWKEAYCMIRPLPNNHYKLLKFIFVN